MAAFIVSNFVVKYKQFGKTEFLGDTERLGKLLEVAEVTGKTIPT